MSSEINFYVHAIIIGNHFDYYLITVFNNIASGNSFGFMITTWMILQKQRNNNVNELISHSEKV